MKQVLPLLCAALILTGCALFQPFARRITVPMPAPSTAVQSLGAQGQTAAALDITPAAQVAAAVAAPSGGAVLGIITVGLGSPAIPGFWLSSNLVTAPVMGSVMTKSGKSVGVELRPSSSGAQLSFAAYRALGLALTELPQVQVSLIN